MREFTTAVEKTQDEADGVEEWIEFKVDGDVWSYQEPDPTQLALLMAAFGRYSSERDQAAGVIDFFVGILDDESHQKAVSRLQDRKDPFGIIQIEEILRGVVEDTTGRPTESRSGSTGSRRTGGRKSTLPTPA